MYAAADGVSAGTCAADAPCDLVYAYSLLDSTRATIRLADGAYSLTTDFVTTTDSFTVVGDRGASLTRLMDGPAFQASNGLTLTLRGFTLNRGVTVSAFSTLVIARVLFDNPTAVVLPWISGDGAAVEVTDSELNDSRSDGIALGVTKLTVRRTAITNSNKNGVTCNGETEVTDSKVERSTLIGIQANELTLLRSSVSENLQGGVSAIGKFEIANNFVFRNGNSKNAKFGGIHAETTVIGSKLEHNTVVFNDSDPFASPLLAGGVFCKGVSAPNNLVYINSSGNNTMPNSQTAGTCGFTGSLILNGNLTNELHFVSPFQPPFDYHLADSGSPAVDQGQPGTVADDIDGEPRTGSPDIGADDLSP